MMIRLFDCRLRRFWRDDGGMRVRAGGGFSGRMLYDFSRHWICVLGRRHDSNSASSSGVTALAMMDPLVLRRRTMTAKTQPMSSSVAVPPRTDPKMMANWRLLCAMSR